MKLTDNDTRVMVAYCTSYGWLGNIAETSSPAPVRVEDPEAIRVTFWNMKSALFDADYFYCGRSSAMVMSSATEGRRARKLGRKDA